MVLLKVICWYWEEWGVYDEGKIKKINSTSCVYILVGMANYIEEGQIDIFKMWLLIGFPFGIYKIHLWLIPKNLDIGGTVGVWTMNIIIGCIMGGFVVIGYILRLLYDVFTVMVERVW